MRDNSKIFPTAPLTFLNARFNDFAWECYILEIVEQSVLFQVRSLTTNLVINARHCKFFTNKQLKFQQNMPKISDILGGLRTAEVEKCATLIQCSAVMKCTVSEVKSRFEKYGRGMLYTSGIVMHDTPRNRHKLTEMYGEIIILFPNGTVYCRTKRNIGQINRFNKRKRIERDKQREKRENEARKKVENTLKMFKDCQGEICRKRQGKANSHDDIGQYVPTNSDEAYVRRVIAEVYNLR